MARDFTQYAKSTYAWQPGHEKSLRVSKSSMTSDFSFCPQQYYYVRVEGRRPPQNDDMTRGINVHDAMEKFFVNVRPSVSKILALAKQNKDEEAFSLMLKCLPEPDEPYALDEEPILQTRLEWEYSRLLATDGKNYLPIINEDEIHTFFNKNVVVNGEEYTVPIHMVGSIDRGFLTDEDTVALMELKTGKWKPTNFKIRGMRKEMAFYATLLKKADHPHKDVTHWGWLFPGGDRLGEEGTFKHWDYEKINKRYFSSNETALESLIEAHIINHFPPDPSQGKCAHCSFMDECPAWQEGGEKHWKQFRRKK